MTPKLRRAEDDRMYRETTQFLRLFWSSRSKVHLKLHRYFPCHLWDFNVANDSNASSTFQARTHSNRNHRYMADWRRFNDHTFSQEWTPAGGVPNVHDLNAHWIHRLICAAWKIDPSSGQSFLSFSRLNLCCGPSRFGLRLSCWSRDHVR